MLLTLILLVLFHSICCDINNNKRVKKECKQVDKCNKWWLVITLILLSTIKYSWATENTPVKDWENPQVISLNKEAGHAFIRPYADEIKAQQRLTSSRIQSLNGKWKFNWVGHPDKRPLDFYKTNYDVNDWVSIDVPGNWQTQGFGRPIYTNHPYPFNKDQPKVMSEPPTTYTNFFDRNPVGSYKHKFVVNDSLDKEHIFVEFQGVKSAFYLWVNGEKVGYSQGSMTPAEFNITEFLIAGENELAVEVYRWSDGSYLEGQDMWRFSGIFRDVNLIARPSVFLQDYKIATKLKNDYQDATLTIDFELDSRLQNRDIKGHQLALKVFSPQGELIHQQQASVAQRQDKMLGNINIALDNVALWSSESPTLYSMMLTVVDKQGAALEYIPWSFGFKETKIKDNQFWVNGRAIKIKGVNRHEHHPRTGRYIDLKTMELDMKLIKQGNFNLVRTSHYPNDHRWYQLANEYGLYILDDANQESHGYKTRNKILGDNPDWTIAHVDRATSMVHTNKNYSAIAIWSLGNEGGAGRNLMAMREAILAIDSSRPILSDTDLSASDFVERSYRTTESVNQYLQQSSKIDKPYMQREYAHAMGNSLGNFQEHWDKIYATKNYVGGAIWDWVDQGLARVKNTAVVSYSTQPSNLALNHQREVWAYGGDFGDTPTDAEFLLNGIVSPDRKPYPSYYEAKKVQQNVWFEQTAQPMKIKVTNRYDFTNLNAFNIVWQIKDKTAGEDKVLAQGKLDIDLEPWRSSLVTIPYSVKTKNNELLLELSVHTKSEAIWSNKGFEVAYQQFSISPYIYPQHVTASGNDIHLNEDDESINISTQQTQLIIDKISGELISYKFASKELLKQPLTPYFWKPVNNNQARNKFIERMVPWVHAAAYRQITNVSVTKLANNLATVQVTARLAVNHALYHLTYRINGEGLIEVNGQYTPDPQRIQHKFMPKFGVKLGLDASLDQIHWYGRGPFENYPDRQTAANIGNYQNSLMQFQVPYISAQDSTNRGGVRHLSFANDDIQLSVQGKQPLNFRAWPYDESDLYSSNSSAEKNSASDRVRRKHYYDLPQRNYINVNLDLKIHGVGGDNSWGGKTMKKYFVAADKPMQFGFILQAKAKAKAKVK